jgi:RimJ/RimL family protein N-acetyltransferase
VSRPPADRGATQPPCAIGRNPDTTTSRRSAPPETSGPVLETPRLHLRWLTRADAPFLVDLVNDPAWLQYIGDRHVHDDQDAQRYLEEGPFYLYSSHGYGPFHVRRKSDGEPLGLCGLYRRDHLPAPDLGFAFLPQHRRQGYAREAAAAVIAYVRDALKLPALLALVLPTNQASLRLLESLAFRRIGTDPANSGTILLSKELV